MKINRKRRRGKKAVKIITVSYDSMIRYVIKRIFNNAVGRVRLRSDSRQLKTQRFTSRAPLSFLFSYFLPPVSSLAHGSDDFSDTH